MAVDTREKRQSSFSLLVPFLVPGVEPSSLDTAGRQAATWVYSGILSGLLQVSLFMASYRRRREM